MNGREIEYDEWVYCPSCQSTDVEIKRLVGDRGGTEQLEIECNTCDDETTVTP